MLKKVIMSLVVSLEQFVGVFTWRGTSNNSQCAAGINHSREAEVLKGGGLIII